MESRFNLRPRVRRLNNKSHVNHKRHKKVDGTKESQDGERTVISLAFGAGFQARENRTSQLFVNLWRVWGVHFWKFVVLVDIKLAGPS